MKTEKSKYTKPEVEELLFGVDVITASVEENGIEQDAKNYWID